MWKGGRATSAKSEYGRRNLKEVTGTVAGHGGFQGWAWTYMHTASMDGHGRMKLG